VSDFTKLRICVHAIAKNETKFVDSFMDWAQHADAVVVLDTGSTDDTVAKLRAHGAIVYERIITPWRFDDARNLALGLAPDDFDIYVWLDLDESLEDGWADKVRAAWKPGTTTIKHPYIHPNGARDRRNKFTSYAWRWKYPVHEDLFPIPGTELVEVLSDVTVTHHPDPTKPRSSYLPLLELLVEENPDAIRHRFWLAREYFFYERWGESIAAFVKYFNSTEPHWDIEDAKACQYMAWAHRGLESEIDRWLLRACMFAPYWPEAWVAVAANSYERGHFAVGLAAARHAQMLHAQRGLCNHYLCEPARHEEISDLLSKFNVAKPLTIEAQAVPADFATGGTLYLPGQGKETIMKPTKKSDLKLVSVTIAGNSKTIERAFASVKGYVDEIVLIDTGITDDTMDRALLAADGTPFRVVKYAWCEDFSAARNFALDMAKTSHAHWALILDSDEWMNFPEGIDLKQRLFETQEGAALVPFESMTYHKVRFVKIPSATRFEGQTHEVYMGSGPHWNDLTFGEHDKTHEQLQMKFARDRKILERVTAKDPKNQRWWYYLGDTYENLGELDKAIHAFTSAGKLNGWDEEGAWAWYRAAQLHVRKSQNDKALVACQEGLRRHPGTGELAWMAAHVSYYMGRYKHAVAYAATAVALGEHAGCAQALGRTSFKYIDGLWQKPYEVLKFAYDRLGERELAAEAAECEKRASARITNAPVGVPIRVHVASALLAGPTGSTYDRTETLRESPFARKIAPGAEVG
jgi:glycosyltransferase involved in cell wall biosynthesis